MIGASVHGGDAPRSAEGATLRVTPAVVERWVRSFEPIEVFKDDARSRVWRLDPDVDRFPGGVVVKQYTYSPLRQKAAWLLGLHPVQRERRAAARLARLGVGVLPLLAAGLGFPGGAFGGWVVTGYVGLSLVHVLRPGSHREANRRHRLTEEVTARCAELIRHNLFFRDLKTSNLLVDAEDRVWVIDTGSLRGVRGRGDVWRMLANLDRTAARDRASRTDRLRCLKQVLALCLDLGPLRDAARQIAGR